MAAIVTSGCAHREFRVAEIGSDGSFELAGDEDSAIGTAPTGGRAPLVTSGNLLIGSGSRTVLLGGTVTGTLDATGQTVVQLASGTSVLLNGVGGTLGDVVGIDVNAGQVVSGPVSLLGTAVAGGGGGAGGAGGASLPQVTARTSVTSTVTGAAGGTQALLPRNSATGRVTGTVTNTATGTLKNVLGKPCC